jgi:hypothetical protein
MQQQIQQLQHQLQQLSSLYPNVKEQKHQQQTQPDAKSQPQSDVLQKQIQLQVQQQNAEKQLFEIRGQKHKEYQLLKKSPTTTAATTTSEATTATAAPNEPIAPWEANSTGIATKILEKYGYEDGQGLGRNGNGIVEPVQAVKKTRFNPTVETSDSEVISNRVNNNVKHWPNNTTLIIGDSIIGGVEEAKLKNYGAKVRRHGGATVDDIHDFIAPLLKETSSQK